MALTLNGSGTIQADDITLSGNANVTGTMTSTGALTASGTLTSSGGISGNSNFDSATLYVDATNNRVGIGTDAPSAPLHIDGGVDYGTIRLQGDSGGSQSTFEIRAYNGGFYLYDIVDSATRFQINTLGVADMGETNIGGSGIKYDGVTANANRIAFRWSSPTLQGVVDNAVSFSVGTTSDYRLKDNVTNLGDMTDKVKLLRPITFNPKELQTEETDLNKTHIGFIAHEMQDIFPHLVSGEKDAVNEDGIKQYQTLDYAGLTPILAKALQEAITKIEALEARIESLENPS